MRFSVSHPPYIIAEIGACHNGSLSTALDLIRGAAFAGAHAVKFQLYDAERLSRQRHAEAYRNKYADFQLPIHWLPILRDMAKKNALDFVLSVYDLRDLDTAQQYADILKISSFEAEARELRQACEATGLPLIISTGMATGGLLHRLRLFQQFSASRIALLHCVSAYPAPVEDLNLSVIDRYHLDGFSDHSANVLTGALAVSHGAEIVEVHLRGFDTPASNPDFPHALTPAQLAEYVSSAIYAKRAIGTRKRTIYGSEKSNTAYKTRSAS